MMRDDEPILEYLRSRARVRPPMDLVGAIADAVVDVPQRRHAWFAPFVPAVAIAGVAAAVVALAVLIGQDGSVGPPTGESPTQGATTQATPSPTPSAEPAPTLLDAGQTLSFDAIDAAGTWGTVTLTRGEDVGGYDDGSVSADSFVVEVHVEYVADRTPDPAEFGRPDWALVTSDGRELETLLPGGRREATRPSLVTYPGAIDIFTNPLEGWLLFVVPRDASDQTLTLVYRPAGLAEPRATIEVRHGGDAPEPVAAATPAPTPAPVTYVEREGYPFTVIDSPEADELFATPDTCTNPEAGYTISYPDAWFTNTDIGDWAPCTWFSPVFFSVGDDPNQVPPQVAIVITVSDAATGWAGGFPETAVNDAIAVAGFEATRMEVVGIVSENGETTPQPPTYTYSVIVAPQPAESPTLTAGTHFEGASNYELNKAVLDRIMALIEFDE